MKVLVAGIVLLGLFFMYRLLAPSADIRQTVPHNAPFPDADSLVSSICESQIMAAVKGFPEIEGANIAVATDRSFKWYAAQIVVTDASGLSHKEDWACRYYRDGLTDVKQLGSR